MNTGEKIKTIRNLLNMSVVEFAETMGISRNTVMRWEGGSRKPSKSHLKLITFILTEKLWSLEDTARDDD